MLKAYDLQEMDNGLQSITFFVISLYLCTQHLFTELAMNDSWIFQPNPEGDDNNNFIYIALKSNNCPKRYLITQWNIKNLNYKISTII